MARSGAPDDDARALFPMPSADKPARCKITGVCAPARSAVLTTLFRRQPAPVWLVITEEQDAAEQLAEDLLLLYEAAGGDGLTLDVRVFPESLADSRNMREAFAASSDRLAVLSKLRTTRTLTGAINPPLPTLVVATTPTALLQPVPALEEFMGKEIGIVRGQRQPFQGFIEQLRAFDYDSEVVCETPGQYAVRGGIIDVYPVTATHPYRLDFLGDEIEDIRAFDPVTQRSGDRIERLTLSGSPRLQLAPSVTGLADYLNPRTHLAFIEPAALEAIFSLIDRSPPADAAPPPAGPVASLAPLLARCTAVFGLSDLDEASTLFEGAETEQTWDTESLVHHRRYPDDALVAHERLQAEEEARQQF
ncbi:MAG: transcription-repair coupling factor, partial [Opitutaceae bacterium]